MDEQQNDLIEQQAPEEIPEEQTRPKPNMRTHYLLRILVGGYLAYLGGQLIKSYLKGGPSGTVAIIAGPAFVLLGTALVIWSVVLLFRDDE